MLEWKQDQREPLYQTPWPTFFNQECLVLIQLSQKYPTPLWKPWKAATSHTLKSSLIIKQHSNVAWHPFFSNWSLILIEFYRYWAGDQVNSVNAILKVLLELSWKLVAILKKQRQNLSFFPSVYVSSFFHCIFYVPFLFPVFAFHSCHCRHSNCMVLVSPILLPRMWTNIFFQRNYAFNPLSDG